ncbi:hypothetical protein ML435_01620 [Staphylococcus roterodami]|nr:hypothetical protein ML435_01620 [Staphylococcus roterodami]
MNRKTPKTTDDLMRHIRDNKGIQINGSTEKIQLRNIGYFHGFKGYNFFLNKEENLILKNSANYKLYTVLIQKLKAFSINTLCSVKQLLKTDC